MLSLKNIFPKKLSIREVHQLYKILKSGLPEKDEQYLLYETLEILKGITTQQFREALKILYGKEVNENPIDIAVLFVEGLKKSEFFAFRQFISGLTNGRS